MKGTNLGLALGLAAGFLAGGAVFAFDGVDFRVSGEDSGLVRTLRESSSLLQAEREKTVEGQDLFTAAQAEYARMVGALYAEGHYSPVVHVFLDGREAASIAPLDAPGAIGKIVVTVDPGPQFAFSRAKIGPLAPGTVLPRAFALGERARSLVIGDTAKAATDGWRDIGHAKAAIGGRKIVANHATSELSAEIAVEPGPRLRFGPLVIEGESRMREQRIREIAGLPEGTVFSPKELNRVADRLRRTGVFQSVTLVEDKEITAPDLLGITATVSEQLPRHFSFGAELSNTEGASLTGKWIHRNLFGGAERLTLEGSVTNIGGRNSGTDYALGVTLERPATFTPDTTAAINLGVVRLDEESFDADIGTVGISLSHVFNENLTGKLGIEYSYGRFVDPTGAFDFEQIAVPASLTWDKRDNRLNPTKGFFLDGELKPFKGFGITSSGTRVKLDARAYKAFGEKAQVVLAGRLQAGAVFGADIATTPRDYLFYSGGGGTVRGQPYQSLGVNVLQAGGQSVQTGGTEFLGGSVELRAKVTETIGVVGFFDAGQVAAMNVPGTTDWQAGAGLGLRYNTGFGPIRLDVAAPVRGKTGDGVQIYVGIGQAF